MNSYFNSIDEMVEWALRLFDRHIRDSELSELFFELDEWSNVGYANIIREKLFPKFRDVLKNIDNQNMAELKTMAELCVADMKREKKAVRWYWRLFF